jgi:N-methylhydantoinase B
VFGVVPGNAEATASTRARILAERLARAQAAPHPLTWSEPLRAAAEGVRGPLAIGVEQRGSVAVGEQSGAPLALAPRSWTDGCPRIHRFLPSSQDVDIVAYLDPVSGHLLAVDVAPVGEPRSFDTAPTRWKTAQAHSALTA